MPPFVRSMRSCRYVADPCREPPPCIRHRASHARGDPRAIKLSPDIGVDDLLPLIRAAAEALDRRRPAEVRQSRLRQARRQTTLFPQAIRREIEYRNRPVRSNIETGAPLSVEVEIDHTVADVHLIEPRTGASIGRPVLTMIMIGRPV